jgi:hypothetical protein
MGKTVAILQSNYLPWKGYFDIIHDVDEFIFYDDVQFTKNDWRNRNLIKTPKHTEWLSIPVGSHIHRLICEVAPSSAGWQQDHWNRIERHYRNAPHFQDYRGFLQDFYLRHRWENLSVLNQHLIKAIAGQLLGIHPCFRDSCAYQGGGSRLERLLDILKKAGADVYVSGPSAKSYIDASRFEECGIRLQWKDYSDYPEYPQFHPPFTHQVTILDLLFQVGPAAPQYIWGHRLVTEAVVSEENA